MHIINEDDICDIIGGKPCNNCGKCLEMEGIDIKAINIDSIAKKEEENDFLESQLTDSNFTLENLELEKIENDWGVKLEDYDLEYEDAFEHIEYLEDMDFNDDLFLEENTEELAPGLRRIKRK